MSYFYSLPLVSEDELAEARQTLGPGLARILGYFEEDGAKSIAKIEQAMAASDAAAIVIPAHTLKGESRQFGARRLGDLAETIEKTARRCVEERCTPGEVATEIAMLRACFVETLTLLRASYSGPPSPALFQANLAPIAPRPKTFATGPRTFGRRTVG